MSTEYKILEQLNGRHFSGSAVAYASGSGQPADLINLINKTSLRLFSESPGRGKPRQFCLIDCYVLSLAKRLVDLTNQYSIIDRVNQMNFEDHDSLLLDGSSDFQNDKNFRSAICENISIVGFGMQRVAC